MSTILFNSELVRFPDKEDLPKQQLLGAFPQPWHTRGRIFTGEMAQLPGSYHHRLPMLREQTAHYPSCRCLRSPRRKSRSQCPKMVGSARDRACPWYTPPTASMSTHELLSYPESIWGRRRGEGRCWGDRISFAHEFAKSNLVKLTPFPFPPGRDRNFPSFSYFCHLSKRGLLIEITSVI